MNRASFDVGELQKELHRIVGDKRLSLREHDLVAYSRDMWPRQLLALRDGAAPSHAPHAVVWPETVREVAAIVRTAQRLRVPIIPYGGGSGVCGGTVPVIGGLTLDLKRMDALLSVDDTEMVCDVEAGANGERFERALENRGYTAGNFPSSIYCSTVGGWIACRAAGQMSTKYGKIEDRVVGLTVVTGRGEIVHTDDFSRAHTGPNWTQLLVGSEGTLGIITSARIRLSQTPALRRFRGFRFENVEAGMEAIRRVMQRDLRPAVVRLYDELDTFVHQTNSSGDTEEPAPEAMTGALPELPGRLGAQSARDGFLGSAKRLLEKRNPISRLRRGAMAAALSRPRVLNGLAQRVTDTFSKHGCLLIVGLEGSSTRTETESRLVFAELELAGGQDLGEEPGRHWLEKRYSVSYGMSKVFREGALVDTMEVASTWDRLPELYRAVKQAIGQHALVMAHFSHAYSEGCSIYFTFVGHGNGRRASEKLYDAIWRDGMAAVNRAGGTISHHHGVGLLKSPWMQAEHREAMHILRSLKASLDPSGIMNPGKLALPGLVP